MRGAPTASYVASGASNPAGVEESMRKGIAIAATAFSATFAIMAFSSSASAQESDRFAKQGSLIFSADRLFGGSNYSATRSQNGQDQTESGTQINFLWGSSSTNLGSNPYTTPRLSFDYAVVDGVTVGGSVGYSYVSSKTEANGQSQDGPSTGTLAAMVRGGYVIPLQQHGIWLRGGFTYFNASTTSTAQGGASNKSSLSGFAVSLEPTFVFHPFQHVGFTGGIDIDFPITGSQESNGQSVTAKVTNYGVMFGMLVDF